MRPVTVTVPVSRTERLTSAACQRKKEPHDLGMACRYAP